MCVHLKTRIIGEVSPPTRTRRARRDESRWRNARTLRENSVLWPGSGRETCRNFPNFSLRRSGQPIASGTFQESTTRQARYGGRYARGEMDAGIQGSGDAGDLELRLESARDTAPPPGRTVGAGVGLRPARWRTAGVPAGVRDVPALDSRIAVVRADFAGSSSAPVRLIPGTGPPATCSSFEPLRVESAGAFTWSPDGVPPRSLESARDRVRDRWRGFRYAANHVRDATVKSLFLEIASQRDEFAGEILPHAQRLGGAMELDGSVAGALHRGWMTIKDTMGVHDDAAIIREAERGERAALAAYEDALNGMLPPTARDVIERQWACQPQPRACPRAARRVSDRMGGSAGRQGERHNRHDHGSHECHLRSGCSRRTGSVRRISVLRRCAPQNSCAVTRPLAPAILDAAH